MVIAFREVILSRENYGKHLHSSMQFLHDTGKWNWLSLSRCTDYYPDSFKGNERIGVIYTMQIT